MGLAFAESLVEFASQVKNVPVSSVSKVESNPGQSKHLETAKTNILNTELDFVNLRSEEYAEGSRIPTEVVNSFRALHVSSFRILIRNTRRLGLLCRMRSVETLRSTRSFTTYIHVPSRTIRARYRTVTYVSARRI
jgi:hypothetical protein